MQPFSLLFPKVEYLARAAVDPGWQVVSVIPQSPRHPSQSLLPWVGADTLHRAPEYSRGQTWLAAHVTVQLTRMTFRFPVMQGPGIQRGVFHHMEMIGNPYFSVQR